MTLSLPSLAQAQALNPYVVDTPATGSQNIDGVFFMNPGVHDGLHFDLTALAPGAGGMRKMEYRLERDANWESNVVGVNDAYINWSLTGTSAATDVLSLYSLNLKDGCDQFSIRLRHLRIEQAVLETTLIEDPCPGVGIRKPVDFSVSGLSGSPATITLSDGGLDLDGLALQSFFGLDINVLAGTGFIALPLQIAGQPLKIDVSPTATFEMRANNGPSHITSAPNVSADNATVRLVGDELTSGVNFIWGLSSRSGQDFVLQNASTLEIGDGLSTMRAGLEFAANEGVQVNDSLVDIKPFATFAGNLLLDNGQVNVGAQAMLQSGLIRASGNSALVSDVSAKHGSLGTLEIPSGVLAIEGGFYVLDGDNYGLTGELRLGSPGGEAGTLFVADQSIPPGDRPITPDLEFEFVAGGRLTGTGRIMMDQRYHAVGFQSGASLAPGFSIGAIRIDGELFMEGGATVEMELDASQLGVGNVLASDQVQIGGPHGLLFLGIGDTTHLDLTVLNDQVLPPGASATLMTYPDAASWNGSTFSGLPNNGVFPLGANLWKIQYDAPIAPGMEFLPTRVVKITVVTPQLTVLPTTAINVGASEVGVTGAPYLVTLRNDGGAPLALASIVARLPDNSGPHPDYAVASDNCTGQSLAPLAQCTFQLRFTPSVAGNDVALLSVNGSSEASITGEGIPAPGSGQVTLSPPLKDFGAIARGSDSVQVFSLTNNSGVDLNALTLSISQLNADFSIINDGCTGSLGNGTSCGFDVRFAPGATGQLTGVLKALESGVTVVNAGLLGVGAATTLSVSPDPVVFADQPVGTASAPQTITVTNTGMVGADSLVISQILPSSGDYLLSNDLCTGVSVAPTASCTFDLAFKPAVAGDDPAALSIVSNALGSPRVVDVSGKGLAPQFRLDPPLIDFGEVSVGFDSAPGIVKLTNTGSAPLAITSIAPTSAEYRITANTCGTNVPVGASCEVTVVANLAAVHASTAALEIISNATNSPNTVQLRASGRTAPSTMPVPALSLPMIWLLTLGILVIAVRRMSTSGSN